MCKIDSSRKGIGLHVQIVGFIVSNIRRQCSKRNIIERDKTDIAYHVIQYLCLHVIIPAPEFVIIITVKSSVQSQATLQYCTLNRDCFCNNQQNQVCR